MSVRHPQMTKKAGNTCIFFIKMTRFTVFFFASFGCRTLINTH